MRYTPSHDRAAGRLPADIRTLQVALVFSRPASTSTVTAGLSSMAALVSSSSESPF
jgi:hypothetical protein